MKNELCIAKDAIASDSPAPEQGDQVSFTVEGTVSRIEGDKIYVEAATANGVPMPAAAEEPAEMDDDDLRGMAEKSDMEAGYV
jgi:hypothetical protein